MKYPARITALWALAIILFTSGVRADYNVLIIGTSRTSSYSPTMEQAFIATNIVHQFREILMQDAAITSTVNVVFQDINTNQMVSTQVSQSPTTYNFTYPVYSLAQWYYWPDAREARFEIWREGWDAALLLDDPYVIARVPGFHLEGVDRISREIEAGGGQPYLMMPWPRASLAGSTNLARYAEVTRRVARGAEIPHVPAGAAWGVLTNDHPGLITNVTHPSSEGSYLAAATFYSKVFERSATNSTYVPSGWTQGDRDIVADIAHQAVLDETVNGVVTGRFNQVELTGFGDIRTRHLNARHSGSSTEMRIMDQIEWVRIFAGMHYKEGAKAQFSEGRHAPSWHSDADNYEINTNLQDFAFAYPLQNYAGDLTHRYGIDSGPWGPRYFYSDLCVSYQQNLMGEAALGGRLSPNRLLWARAYDVASNNVFALGPDNWHLDLTHNECIAAYMVTLMTGRNPIGDPAPHPDSYADWMRQMRQVGYETAWRLATLNARVPGFEVLPRESTADTLAVHESEPLTVRFHYAPTATVHVAVSVTDSNAAVVNPPVLTFTPDNHDQIQTVTVTGLPGAETNAPFEVVLTPTSDDFVYRDFEDRWSFITARTETQSIDNVYLANEAITAGDTRPLPLSLSASLDTNLTHFAGPAHGSLAWIDGTLVYTPDAGFTGTDSFVHYTTENGTTYVGTVTFDVTPRLLDVFGNGHWIASGDTTPSINDHTDFGPLHPAHAPIVHTFTLTNPGPASVDLTDAPAVEVTGDAVFTLETDAAVTTLNPGDATTFAVQFDPVSAGVYTASISIANDGGLDEPYTFSIAGAGVEEPDIIAHPASAVSNRGARLHATLNAGVISDLIFYWGPSDGGTNPLAWEASAPQPAATDGAWHHDAEGLIPDTDYRFRVYASNTVGTAWSDPLVFTTLTVAATFPDTALPYALAHEPYEENLLDMLADTDLPYDAFTVAASNGPAWLNVSPSGALTGLPLDADVGSTSIAVRVTDNYSNETETILTLDVQENPAAFIPYADDFESYIAHTSLVGSNGWSAPRPEQGMVIPRVYLPQPGVLRPLPFSTPANVLQADEPLSLRFQQTDEERDIWFDSMIHFTPTDPSQQATLDAQEQIQTAWFAGTNGHLHVYHGASDGVAYSNVLSSFALGITNGQWSRVTIRMAYTNETRDRAMFQFQLDRAAPLESPQAYDAPESVSTSATGTWFLCANPLTHNDKLARLRVAGQGMLDDVVVATSEIVDPDVGSLQVNLGPPAILDSAAWRLTVGSDTSWKSSGDILDTLVAGTQTVVFATIAGWQPLPPTEVTILNNQQTVLETNYTAMPGDFSPQPVVHYTFDHDWPGSVSPALDTGSGDPANALFSGDALRIADTPGDYTLAAMSTEGGALGSHVGVAPPDKINGMSQFTVTTWINLREDPGHLDRIMAMSDATDGFEWYIHGHQVTGFSRNKFRIGVVVDNVALLASEEATPDDGWIFLALSYDGTLTANNVNFYIGGETNEVVPLGDTVSRNSGWVDWTTGELRIGGTTRDAADRTPDAWYDDVRIYDRILTQNELQLVRQAGMEPPETGSAQLYLGPDAAIDGGALWRLIGAADTNWLASGATTSNVLSGVYDIAFTSVAGWFAPTGKTVEVQADVHTVQSYNYQLPGANLGPPALHYLFDEASTGSVVAVDTGSGAPADGVFSGGAIRTADTPAGRSLGAMSTAGGAHLNHVETAAPGKINGLTAFTVTMWMKLLDDPNPFDRFISMSDGSSGFELFFENNSAGFGRNEFGLTLMVDDSFITSSTQAQPEDGWFFVAATYDGTMSSGNVHFYLGSETGAVSQVGSPVTRNAGAVNVTANDLRIGGTTRTTDDRTPHALFDDIRIYPQALDVSHVEAVRLFALEEFTAEPAIEMIAPEDSGLRVTLPAMNGEIFILQTNTNLVHGAWMDISTNSAVNETAQFDYSLTNAPFVLFRILKP